MGMVDIRALAETRTKKGVFGLYVVVADNGKPIRVYTGKRLGKNKRMKSAITWQAWGRIFEKLMKKVGEERQ